MTRPADTARAIASCLRGEKPVLVSFMGGHDVMPGREELVESNLPDYTAPERAVAALRAMHDYAVWRRRPTRIVARFPVNRRRVTRTVARHLRSGQRQMGEVQAKDIMRAYNFTIPAGHVAATTEDAVEAASKIGKRPSNDDAHMTHETPYGTFFAICDGHGEVYKDRIAKALPQPGQIFAERVARSVQEDLPKVLQRNLDAQKAFTEWAHLIHEKQPILRI